MTHLPADHPFRKHSQNLQAVRRGLTQLERLHKHAIRRSDDAAVAAAARLHEFMVGLLAESALRKILYDPDGFNEKERGLIATGSQLERWLRCVEFAFRRHYLVPLHQEINQFTTSATAAGQFEAISELLRGDLAAVIEDRNHAAHAQWVWVMNAKETAFTGRASEPLNYVALRTRSRVILEIAALIGDLVVSPPTFDRDFARHYGRIADLRKSLTGAEYPAFVDELRSRNRPPTTL